MEVKRTERGWAGHFCCSYRCEYHRNTLLEYNGMKVVVSTVGRLRKDMISDTYEDLGYKRYFETMAFMANEDDKYNDADVDREIQFDAKWCLPSPDMELEADAMHEDVVIELSKRLVDGTLVLTSEIEGVTEETAQRFNNILKQFSETLEKCKKRTMKKRKMKSLTLQERILLCKIDEIDWNYSVKATKTNDIRTTIQGE